MDIIDGTLKASDGLMHEEGWELEEQTIVQYRIRNQLLGSMHAENAVETVKWMGAVQGQDYSPGLWAVGLRTPHTSKEEIEKCLEDKKIVRSWTMRHTIHFVAMEDLRWMIHFSKDKMVQRYKNHMEKEAGLDESTLRKSLDVFIKILEGKKLVSRSVLRERLEEAGVDTSKQRFYHLLWYAAQNGLIFIGPMEGKQQSFGLVEEWAPKQHSLTKEEALYKLAVNYLNSHGPATVQDFAWWSGLSQKEAKLGFQSASALSFDIKESKREYWYLMQNQKIEAAPHGQMHLLYGLDEFFIGYKNRSDVLEEQMYRKIDPNRQGLFFPLFFEGKIVGHWKPIIEKKAIFMKYSLAEATEVSEDRLNSEAKRYSDFFHLSLHDVQIQYI